MKIVSIGGGSIHLPRRRPQTTPIDKAIIALSGKKKPRVLFIPTASEDSQEYADVFIAQYAHHLGCSVEVLTLFRDRPSQKEIAAIIDRADIIYVGGGNTMRMMKLWRKLGVDRLLWKAAKRGAVCSGLSAGAICWFREGNSDSLKYSNPKADYCRVKTLNFIDALLCPHYDGEADRQPSLKKMMKKVPGIAIALDNCAAIEISADRYRIITCKKSAHAHRIFWNDGQYVHEKMKHGAKGKLKDLLSKTLLHS
jgi:dipeptidase E